MRISRRRLAEPALVVAPQLLGAVLVSEVDDKRVVVRITEVEAYEGQQDPASHAYRGPTGRTQVMFGEAGHLYCYFVYGMHWCANVTCEVEGTAAAVLLRAAEIVEGESVVRARTTTSMPFAKLASGPARLARALGLNGAHTGLDLLGPTSLVRLESLGRPAHYLTGPRVGVAVAADRPWRFWLPDDASVSPFRAGGRRRVTPTRQT